MYGYKRSRGSNSPDSLKAGALKSVVITVFFINMQKQNIYVIRTRTAETQQK